VEIKFIRHICIYLYIAFHIAFLSLYPPHISRYKKRIKDNKGNERKFVILSFLYLSLYENKGPKFQSFSSKDSTLIMSLSLFLFSHHSLSPISSSHLIFLSLPILVYLKKFSVSFHRSLESTPPSYIFIMPFYVLVSSLHSSSRYQLMRKPLLHLQSSEFGHGGGSISILVHLSCQKASMSTHH
jgi:hypothetical protein